MYQNLKNKGKKFLIGSILFPALLCGGLARAEGNDLSGAKSGLDKHLIGKTEKTWDLSFSGYLGYTRTEWNKSPDGNHHDSDYSWGIEGRLALRERWGLKPTFSVSYQRFNFDFSSLQAPVQKATPEFYTIAVGVTKETKLANGFLLAGLTKAYFNPKLVENIKGKPFPHKGKPEDTYLMFRLGVNKLFNFSKFKVGLETSCDIYPEKPKFHRCRWFEMSNFFGWLGIRIQL